MSRKDKVAQYRDYLSRLSYPEYAYRQATNAASGGSGRVLDLSLWNDGRLPPGIETAVRRNVRTSVGAYRLAQDGGLVKILAEKLGTPASSIVITAGADDALRAAAQYCIRPGTRTLIPTPCFGRYIYHALINQAKVLYVPFGEFPFELDVVKIVAEAERAKAECLFIASPNNPTGHALDRSALNYLLDNVNCAVILDESLSLTVRTPGDAVLVHKHQNLFLCGSFSKLYGLAGLRIGYLMTHPANTRQLKQLLSPFGVDALALEVAKHVLASDLWLDRRMATIRTGLAALRSVNNPRVRITRSTAPVALVEYTPHEQGSLYQLLQSQDILTVAGQEFPGLARANTVRVIIKNVKDMRQLKHVLDRLS